LSELAPNIREYEGAYRAAGHPGEPQTFLRVPMYIADTPEQARAEPEASVMQFYRAFSRRLGASVGLAGVVRSEERAESAQRLQEITYDEVLRDKIIAGTPEMVTDRLRALRAELGLGGILVELNSGNLIPPERVKKSLQLLCEEVMPDF
jgi:alkanesulfonate monooxygenase SsuD/methylene tetrahydromethanopterin reductase-like flavin-dependent oxidoreductase (luciferase family)